ncbi:TetR/AcrR family transcriptional regulator [Thiorhodococcus fuscus]|uniref:TetR/AcrR family transcriptional regulator n=1 Tax=Thiorhodococcus fuscus TaxID=527200 RepID=A0ABW4Y4P2_9GAMM
MNTMSSVTAQTSDGPVIEDRKDMIFHHASRVFAAKGYAGTKITDIAAAANMSQGLLYRYFDSKERLFTELVRASFERLNASVSELEQMPLSAGRKIALALEQVVGGMETDSAFAERVLLIAQATLSEGIPETTKQLILRERDKPYEAIARIMAKGQEEGGIRPGSPEDLSLLFWTNIKGLALHKVSFGSRFWVPDLELLIGFFVQCRD